MSADVGNLQNDRDTKDFSSAQANIARLAKLPNEKPRDWSLYLFFRIMRQTEVVTQDAIADNIRKLLESPPQESTGEASDESRESQNQDPPPEDKLRAYVQGAVANLTSPELHKALQDSLSEKSGDKGPDRKMKEVDAAGEQSVEPQTEIASRVEDSPRQGNLQQDMKEARKPATNFFEWLDTVSREEPRIQDAIDESDQSLQAISEVLNGVAQETGEIADRIKAILADQEIKFEKKILDVEKVLLAQLADGMGSIDKISDALYVLEELNRTTGENKQAEDVRRILATAFLLFAQRLRALLKIPHIQRMLLAAFGKTAESAGHEALKQGLPLTILYAFLKMVRRDDGPEGGQPLLRNEKAQATLPKTGADDANSLPSYPINLYFTYSGMDALQLVDRATLESFPAAFKEGMAERAKLLGDVGPSAPVHWDGELGSRHVHGYLNTNFHAGNPESPIEEETWKRLRSDIRHFNGQSVESGVMVRRLLSALLPVFGIELLHIELGQDPYKLEKKGPSGGDAENQAPRIVKPNFRQEHFGFRDGISQPVVDMKLGDTDPGGGTPDRNRGWQVVAPGEIYLGHPDEEGVTHLEPANEALRDNGTFVVFRKLEQDVVGFSNFLKLQRPDPGEQNKLAAQLMGRWKSGVSLVDSPHSDIAPDGLKATGLNDFLYAEDDPAGRKCPLGSHVRRSNPRDTGSANEVRRHRILRRSMSYGGSLLPEGSLGDGEPRGLLFVAANSRIEQQFEVIQSAWINGSEFLAQAGLGKCPIAGSNHSTASDIFHEAHSPVPVTHLPNFVTTRGGDYFFAPSLSAIHAIATGGLAGKEDLFPPDDDFRDLGFRVGRAKTPILFEEERLENYVHRLADRKDAVIRIKQQSIPGIATFPHAHIPKDTEPDAGKTIVFVGWQKDVHHVLAGQPSGNGSPLFTVPHYRRVARRVLRGGLIPVATDLGRETEADRKRLHDILSKAWQFANEGENEDKDKKTLTKRIERVANDRQSRAIRAARQVGRIDLVHDLATRSVYDVIEKCYGIPGPHWLTELAASLPFARKHVGELHQDWLTVTGKGKVDNPAQATLQIWSILFFADLITNVKSQQELHDLGQQAGTEFLTHLDSLLKSAREYGKPEEPTLLDAFVSIEKCVLDEYKLTEEEYYRDVAGILLELTAATMLNIPAIFGKVMDFALTNRMDLSTLVPLLESQRPSFDHNKPNDPNDPIIRFIYECDRLNPAFGLFLRYCEEGGTLAGSGKQVEKDEWVLGFVNAANLDENAFPHRLTFSLAPSIPGPERCIDNYLLFGASPNENQTDHENRVCRGRDYIALFFLRNLVRQTQHLPGLRKVPGPQGEIQDLLRVPIGLNARCAIH